MHSIVLHLTTNFIHQKMAAWSVHVHPFGLLSMLCDGRTHTCTCTMKKQKNFNMYKTKLLSTCRSIHNVNIIPWQYFTNYKSLDFSNLYIFAQSFHTLNSGLVEDKDLI